MSRISTIEELEACLSRPTHGVLDTLRQIDGDIMVLGAGGKMGPTLARMARRALDEIGHGARRVIAVSRFSSPKAARSLRDHGVETISCDLLNRDAVNALPEVPNVIFMAGQKFGTSDAPELTWAMNTIVPAIVAEHFAKSRIVVYFLNFLASPSRRVTPIASRCSRTACTYLRVVPNRSRTSASVTSPFCVMASLTFFTISS